MTPAPPDASAAVTPDGPIAPKRHSLKRTFTATIAERSYFGLTILAGLVAVVAIGFFFWKTFAQTTETWSTFGVWGFITGT